MSSTFPSFNVDLVFKNDIACIIKQIIILVLKKDELCCMHKNYNGKTIFFYHLLSTPTPTLLNEPTGIVYGSYQIIGAYTVKVFSQTSKLPLSVLQRILKILGVSLKLQYMLSKNTFYLMGALLQNIMHSDFLLFFITFKIPF